MKDRGVRFKMSIPLGRSQRSTTGGEVIRPVRSLKRSSFPSLKVPSMGTEPPQQNAALCADTAFCIALISTPSLWLYRSLPDPEASDPPSERSEDMFDKVKK